jgi:dynein heavy chain
VQTFGVSATVAEEFVLENLEAVNAVLIGEEPRIFVFSNDEEGKEEEKSAGAAAEQAPLVLSHGDDIPMLGRALFIVRNTLPGRAVDMEKGNDGSILVGEISPNPLEELFGQLKFVYGPGFTERTEWGPDAGTADQFRAEVNRFTGVVEEAVQSRHSTIKLRCPDAEYDINDLVANAAQRLQGRTPTLDAAVVDHLSDLLGEWCEVVGRDLDAHEMVLDENAGPRSILDWWRVRMQKLTSVTEQLRSPECSAVIMILSLVVSCNHGEVYNQDVSLRMRNWKVVNMAITEAANEARDNVKYLFTLGKFIEPLYSGTPITIVDALPALLNSVKMIHSIARYFNTEERMTDLMVRITAQMINSCLEWVLAVDPDTGSNLWKKNADELVGRLRDCMELNRAYQETYRAIRDKAEDVPGTHTFDFSESAIFARFDLFCRRGAKLAQLFSTISQFARLKEQNLEGMERVHSDFQRNVTLLQAKRHNLLAFADNGFDRDFVEFNAKVDELEGAVIEFIDESFNTNRSIAASLSLLQKFQLSFTRPSLAAHLDEKMHMIFRTYGEELERVQEIYESQKHNPPKARNLPPVAGSMTWARHLYKRIEGPMKIFEAHQAVLASRDAKRIVRLYNRVARTLVAFEMLWYQAWVESIEAAKAGLQATLIIRHPDDGKLYVNFDAEILQLIREAKCLYRMGVAIPESARMVLLQESKFKMYYTELTYVLRQYMEISEKIIPVTKPHLQPALEDLEYRLRPGMVTLTWTSMNIDAYKLHVHAGLRRLGELVRSVNDIIENRI